MNNILQIDPTQLANFMLISTALYAFVNRMFAKNAFKMFMERIHTRFLATKIDYPTFQYWSVVIGVYVLATLLVLYSQFGDLYQAVPEDASTLALLENTSIVRLFGGNPDNMHVALRIADLIITVVIAVNISAIANWIEDKFKGE